MQLESEAIASTQGQIFLANVANEREQTFVNEAQERFTHFLQAYDCSELLQYIGIRRILFLRHKRAVNVCRAAAVILWYHALLRSFPNCANAMLEAGIHEILPSLYPPAYVNRMEVHIRHLADIMKEKGDSDFTVLAKYILEITAKPAPQGAPITELRLVFYFRTLYATLYDNLI